MAVIKIVPMPGVAVVGPTGPAGTNGTNGTNGADGATPFTFIGAYDNGRSYNLGMAVYYNGGTYVRTGNPLNPGYPPEVGAINASWTPIAEKGADNIAPTSGTWNPRFAELSNITYSDATSLHELGEYYCIGDLVFFDILVKLNNVSDWGTAGIWNFELPFIEKHLTMSGWQSGVPGATFVGNIYDSTVAENISDRTGRDQGSYAVYGELAHASPNRVYLYVTAYDSSLGYNMVGELRALNKSYPSDITQPEIDQSSFRMSGVYRKA